MFLFMPNERQKLGDFLLLYSKGMSTSSRKDELKIHKNILIETKSETRFTNLTVSYVKEYFLRGNKNKSVIL